MNSHNEDFIIISLISDPEYLSIVYGKLKDYFFENYLPQECFKYIQKCVIMDAPLTFDSIKMLINGDDKLKDEHKHDLVSYLDDLKKQEINISIEVLLSQTQLWAKFNSFKTALYESFELVKKEQSYANYQSAMTMVEDSLDITFEEDEYSMSFGDENDRRKRARAMKVENAMLSGFKPFDDLTGGIKDKTLTCFLAPTNQGKTLSMAFLSSCFMIQGFNVAIATLEIACEEYLGRIDANLLDISTYDMSNMDEDHIISKFEKFDQSNDNVGKIEVHQFSEATATDIKLWLKKLYIEKKFKPDIVIIDYLGLMSGSNVKDRSNTYVAFKEISREVRQKICIDMGLPVISAVQSNRAVENKIKDKGKNVEITSADTADSYGVPQNLDTYISQIEIKNGIDEHLSNDIASVYLWRLIKSRNYVETGTKSMVGVSKSKQRLYDIAFENLDVTIINNNKELDNDIIDKENRERDWMDDFNY